MQLKPKYKIGNLIYCTFNHEIHKTYITKIMLIDNMVVYNDYITEHMAHKSQNAAHRALIKEMTKYIKLVDKTK